MQGWESQQEPKTDSNRARNTANILGDVLFFLVFLCIYGGFLGVANFDFRMDCNTFWMISGTSKTSTKYGASDPVLITKILQKIQEKHGNIVENTICHI